MRSWTPYGGRCTLALPDGLVTNLPAFGVGASRTSWLTRSSSPRARRDFSGRRPRQPLVLRKGIADVPAAGDKPPPYGTATHCKRCRGGDPGRPRPRPGAVAARLLRPDRRLPRARHARARAADPRPGARPCGKGRCPRPAVRDGGAREAPAAGARFEVHPGGHAFLLESAGPVAASVLRFLRSIEEDCGAP